MILDPSFRRFSLYPSFIANYGIHGLRIWTCVSRFLYFFFHSPAFVFSQCGCSRICRCWKTSIYFLSMSMKISCSTNFHLRRRVMLGSWREVQVARVFLFFSIVDIISLWCYLYPHPKAKGLSRANMRLIPFIYLAQQARTVIIISISITVIMMTAYAAVIPISSTPPQPNNTPHIPKRSRKWIPTDQQRAKIYFWTPSPPFPPRIAALAFQPAGPRVQLCYVMYVHVHVPAALERTTALARSILPVSSQGKKNKTRRAKAKLSGRRHIYPPYHFTRTCAMFMRAYVYMYVYVYVSMQECYE